MTYQLQQGTPLQPANQDYQFYNLAVTGNLTLKWPFSFLAASQVVVNIMDFDADSDGFIVTLPNATEASTGQSFIFNNLSAFTINLTTFDNLTNFTIPANERWYFYLTDNSTTGGTWQVVIYGAASGGTVDANALAGLGLISLPELVSPFTNVLNTNVVTTVKAANFSPNKVDRASLIVVPVGATLTNIELNTNALTPGFYFTVINESANPFNITATGGTITGSSLPLAVDAGGYFTLVLQSANIWTAIGNDNVSKNAISELILDVSGGNVFLTPLQAINDIIDLVGTLTVNTTVYFPFQTDQWTIRNSTVMGAFSLKVDSYVPPSTPENLPISLWSNQTIVVTLAGNILGEGLNLVSSQNPVVGRIRSIAGTAPFPAVQVGSTNPQQPSNTGLYQIPGPPQVLGFSVNGVSQATLDTNGDLEVVRDIEAGRDLIAQEDVRAVAGNITAALNITAGTTIDAAGNITTTGGLFVGPNVPPGIATATLGTTVLNALVSGSNQAVLGGCGIVQMEIFGNSTPNSTTTALPFFSGVTITPQNANSTILVMGIGYWSFSTPTSGRKWGFINISRSPAFSGTAIRTIQSMATSDDIGSDDRTLNSTPFFFVDSGLTVGTPYQYIFTIGLQSGEIDCRAYINQTPHGIPITTDTTSFCVLMEVGGF